MSDAPRKPKRLFDPEAVVDALRLIVGAGNVVEVRVLEAATASTGRPHTLSGYFDDLDSLVAALGAIKSAKGVYIVLNPMDSGLLERTPNRLRRTPKGQATKDSDIVCRRWLPIDVDVTRRPGTSATEAERQQAYARALEIASYLRDLGWPEPIIADSGNGVHLLYLIDLPTDDRGLVQQCLAKLASLFDDEQVKIDQKVFNPARIWKL
jgi:hypothetical protein